jgi:flagellar hook-associated protein 3 FlgL
MTPISTAAFYDRATYDMGTLRSRAEYLQSQISTGNRLTSSADDPVAAARLRELERANLLTTADTANAQSAASDLILADDALTNLSTVVTRIHELAIQASNGTLNDSQRASIGQEIGALQGNLVSLVNSRDTAGHALFGGDAAGSAYTLDAAGNASYAGTTASDSVALGGGLSVVRSLTGPEFLNFTSGGSASDLLATVKQLAADLQGGAADPAAAARGALDKLTAAQDAISTGQTIIGARLSWIDTTTSIRDNLAGQRSETEAHIGGTDLATTIAQLQQITTVLQASQASFVKLAGLTLFDVIR